MLFVDPLTAGGSDGMFGESACDKDFTKLVYQCQEL